MTGRLARRSLSPTVRVVGSGERHGTGSGGSLTARTWVLAGLALLAFAGNSLLCRLALGTGSIDAASFTALRIGSGAAALVAVLALGARRNPGLTRLPGATRSALALFAYMVCFSFAYRSLGTGTGALILFGSVQITMLAYGLRAGERLTPVSGGGALMAVGGLVYLVAPGVTAPDPTGALLMAAAGASWGAYSLSGRGTTDPLGATAGNFLRCVPLGVLVVVLGRGGLSLSGGGVALAVTSGALASACGYVLWYAALRELSTTRAALVQLAVPALAALGGVVLLSEALTARLLTASAVTLGGVAVSLTQRAGHGAADRGDPSLAGRG